MIQLAIGSWSRTKNPAPTPIVAGNPPPTPHKNLRRLTIPTPTAAPTLLLIEVENGRFCGLWVCWRNTDLLL